MLNKKIFKRQAGSRVRLKILLEPQTHTKVDIAHSGVARRGLGEGVRTPPIGV